MESLIELITGLIKDPEVVLLLIGGGVFAVLLVTGKLVPDGVYKREVTRADKAQDIAEKVTTTLRDVIEAQKDTTEAVKDLAAEVRRK